LKKDVYTILPGGIYFIESLARMSIVMDKFKTSEMGKALKKVYRGEMDVQSSVLLATNEIGKYFDNAPALAIEEDTDVGFFGDVVGKCPVCSKDVVRYKMSYGCSGYKDGCTFSVSTYICGRAISISNVRQLLLSGSTSKIKGFISKKGKLFDACLKLSDGKCVFDFSDDTQNSAKQEPNN
jgi:DNA topoisomerase-3